MDQRLAKRVPLYKCLSEDFVAAISDGRLGARDRLPTESELATRHRVNRSTVRRAYQRLKDRGLIEQVPGRGTFVTPEAPALLGLAPRRRIRRVAWVAYRRVLSVYEFIYSDLFAGVAEACRRRGVDLIPIQVEPETSTLPESTRAELLEFDGVILLSSSRDDRLEPWLLKHDLAGVQVWERSGAGALPLVSYDRRRSAEMVGEHLVARGRERIGILGNLRSAVGESKVLGLLDALGRHGLSLAPQWMLDCRSLPGATYARVQQLIEAKALPDALYLLDDYRAVEAIHALHTAGLCVPDDIAIVGHGDIDGLAAEISLTTVRTPRIEIGRRSLEMLIDWPADGIWPEDVMLESDLIVRGSTAGGPLQVNADLAAIRKTGPAVSHG